MFDIVMLVKQIQKSLGYELSGQNRMLLSVIILQSS